MELCRRFPLQYQVIYSRRKTISIRVREDGEVIVRAPLRCPRSTIERFVNSSGDWIRKHREEMLERKASEIFVPKLSGRELEELRAAARRLIPERCAYYADKIGVTYGRITIRAQRSRWGSCSARGNLNFNCLLMLAPLEVIDSVVVHELCHRKEMNHSARFYAEVRRVFPEYDRWHGWLKENGDLLIHRLPDTGLE